jgi:hypothetical protein
MILSLKFVKMISESVNKWEALYSISQEAKRKDVERGLGVVKKHWIFAGSISHAGHRKYCRTSVLLLNFV